MSHPQWHFNDRRRKDPLRDPIQGEFFANEAIKNPEEALIREGIQNSLDAALKNGDETPVQIRVFLASGDAAASAASVKRFMTGAWDHLNAKGNGIKHPPSPNDSCPFLVFEDFGTCGLDGDVNQSEAKKGNLFFYFFRAEGRSEKLGDKRGRWGVGKHVFPSASQINSIFGLTVRAADGARYLMGRSVLKCHSVEEKDFMPDGYFGLAEHDGFVGPVNDANTLDSFCTTFKVTRKEEPGLSIVMPWINHNFSIKQLITAVLRGYFYPILEGALVVSVETPTSSVRIDDSSITDLAYNYLEKGDEDLRPMLRLGAWAAFAKLEEFVTLKPADPNRPIWNPDLIPLDIIENLRRRFDSGERMAIRVPLTVRLKEKGKLPQESHIDIFLTRDGYESGRPIFVREGIIISGVKAPLVRGVRSLVVASHSAIATLLGDAENPSHTEWLSASADFNEKYFYGRSYLDFVVRSVHEFIRLLTAGDKKGDPLLLLSLFALPSDDEVGVIRPGTKRKIDKGDSNEEKQPPPPPKPKPFKLERVKGGFSITRGAADILIPTTLVVRAAYDVRRGSALGKYRPVDFTMVRPPIHIETQVGIKLREDGPNRLLLDITQPNFHLALGGFDTRRDLFLKVEQQRNTISDD